MRNLLLITLLLLLTQTVYGQQEFRFKYKFKKLIDNGNIELYEVSGKKKDTFTLKTTNLKLRGAISKTSKITGLSSETDTLFVRLWPLKEDNKENENSQTILNVSDNYKDFILTTKKWDTSFWGYKIIDVPFASNQLFAVNIPLRVNLNNGEIASDFINANISVSRIWGKTRFYKTEFVKPRDRFWGLGLFSGLGTTKNSLDEEEVGVFYGGNIIGSMFKVNLIATLGFETSVSKDGKTSPYAGFGFGFDLFSITGTGFSEKE